MLKLEDDIKQRRETIEGSLAKIKEHGNESLIKIVRRQNSETAPNQADLTKIENCGK